MRLTQSKELNKKPEVTGSNPVKYNIIIYFYLPFFIHCYYNFLLLSLGLCLTSLSTFFSHTITINCVLAHVALKHFTLIILAIFFRKKEVY